MLILDIFGLTASLSLLLCALLCVWAIRKGQLRRVFRRLVVDRVGNCGIAKAGRRFFPAALNSTVR